MYQIFFKKTILNTVGSVDYGDTDVIPDMD